MGWVCAVVWAAGVVPAAWRTYPYAVRNDFERPEDAAAIAGLLWPACLLCALCVAPVALLSLLIKRWPA